jgi:FkbM family methyltransferase
VWRIFPPKNMVLHTGVSFPTPKEKAFASDVYVTKCNVDWSSEYILAAYLSRDSARGDFIDVGAHIGYYSCLCSPFVGRIWAFEPDSRNHGYLLRALDGIPDAELIAKAVSDFDGETRFFDEGESSVSHIQPGAESGGSLIPVTTLDSFIEEVGAIPSAIKMDIEGFEILALKGGERSLRRFEPIVLMEYNQEESRPNTWQELDRFLTCIDFTIFAVTSRVKGLAGYEYRFRNCSASDLAAASSKMLFLVPNSKREWFDMLASSGGDWGKRELRPSAVRAFLAHHGA